MDINEQAINVIVNAMKNINTQQGNNLSFDKTQQGHITAVLPDNLYALNIHGKEYPHVPSCVDISYKVNESVWVTIPQNNWNQMFICGRRR